MANKAVNVLIKVVLVLAAIGASAGAFVLWLANQTS